MASLEEILRKAGLPDWAIERILSLGLDLEGLLKMTARDLADLSGVGVEIAEAAIRAAAAEAISPVSAGAELRRRVLSTGVRELDELLRGGLEAGSLVELFGEPGVGKTQFAMHMCVQAALPERAGGLESSPLYIDTEGSFSARRLREMAEERGVDWRRVLEKVRVVEAMSVSSLQVALEAALRSPRGEFGLIVIDSLMYPLRTEYPGRRNLYKRQQLLQGLVRRLKILTSMEQIVLVTNHVVGGPGGKRPAGGYVLGHAADLILMIRRSVGNLRILRVVGSPSIPEGEALFRITPAGLEGPE